MYLFELSFAKHKALAEALDIEDSWEDLAGLSNLTVNDVMGCRKVKATGQSCAEELLRILGSLGYPLDTIFKMLYKMKHRRAMEVIVDLVEEKNRDLLEKLKPDLTGLSKPLQELAVSHNTNENVAPKNYAIAFPGNPLPVNINRVEPESSKTGKKSTFTNSKSKSKQNQQSDLSSSRVSVHSLVSVLDNTLSVGFDDLREATNNFSSENILGKGGYGTVYKANLKHSIVAVKRIACPQTASSSPASNQISEEEKDRWRQSLMEVRISALYRHDNILPLYGQSFDGPEPCLVYQYMPMGSLEDRLLCRKIHNRKEKVLPLNWRERLKIMSGGARGLHFLHTTASEPLIHGDVKSANILLDAHLEPKLGDFGLSRRGQIEVPDGAPPLIASHIKGTLAYLPSEFIRKKHLSSKLDVYSFGVVLFEVATGFRAYSDKRTPPNLVEYMFSLGDTDSSRIDEAVGKILDPKGGEENKPMASGFIKLGLKCAQTDPQERPHSKEMVSFLESMDTLKM